MVAEAVQEELDRYRASEGEVKQLKHAMGLDGESDEAISLLSDNTAKLTSAVSSLPELLERKRLIDAHTTIATGTQSGMGRLGWGPGPGIDKSCCC